jgi:hypothetical protein
MKGLFCKTHKHKIFSVNQCKGNNDCKTAENTCKDHGFVALSAPTCADLGGEVAS